MHDAPSLLSSSAARIRRLALFAALAACAAVQAAPVKSFAQVQREFRSSDAVLFDRHGEVLQQMRLNPRERRLSWTRLEDVSPALRNALVASEDKRFYQHAGVDWNAVAAAAWGNLWNSRTRGASTITMQLAGLLDEELRRSGGSRSTGQKLSQALTAQDLERSWRKDQILEAYLNMVSFRGELVGVHALSRVLFDKHPSGLDQSEAAIAVALIRAPNASATRVAQRACSILREQKAAEACRDLEGVTQLRLARLGARHDPAAASAAPQLAPHIARKLLKTAGQPVYSTLDAGVQRFARDTLTRQLAALADRHIEDGAVLVLDNASGDVLAWVGSSGSLSDAADVDGVVALRQAGSTLKPFLYQLALERKSLTAASILDDSPINLATASGLYLPQNYDRQFKGLVSLRTALGSSLNVPAVRTLIDVTPERMFRRLQDLGFQLRESGDYYGYSLALGSADVSLLALTNAYRTLANQGRYSPTRMARNEAAPAVRKVMDAGSSFIIGDILSDRSARARTFGFENALATRHWSAVKTGTSKDMRDNWCIGYSTRYTVGVWVGNASGQPMWDVSGVTGAAPVWQEVMQYLHSASAVPRRGPQVPPLPPGVVTQQITYQNQLEAPRTEYFLAGTEQQTIALAKPDRIRAAITYPTPGMLIALDPDIPPARQRVRLTAQGLDRGSWALDGKALSTKLEHDWMPRPGKHVLSLHDVKGARIDQVSFEVRGAWEKRSPKASGACKAQPRTADCALPARMGSTGNTGNRGPEIQNGLRDHS
jgi:penicillin-binding protein 1C